LVGRTIGSAETVVAVGTGVEETEVTEGIISEGIGVAEKIGVSVFSRMMVSGLRVAEGEGGRVNWGRLIAIVGAGDSLGGVVGVSVAGFAGEEVCAAFNEAQAERSRQKEIKPGRNPSLGVMGMR
jgi:hypothetical protein